MVHFTSRATGRLTLGTDVWISLAASGGCYLQGENGIVIGDHTMFAPGVKIISANHDATDYHRWTEAEPVRIGCRCWLGRTPSSCLACNWAMGASSALEPW